MINTNMKKSYMNLPTDAGVQQNSSYTYGKKKSQKPGTRREFLCIKGSYKNKQETTAIFSINIVLTGEILNLFLFYYTGCPNWHNNTWEK